MGKWLYDENISKPAVEGFRKAGIDGLHVAYDLNLQKIDDQTVVKVSREKKSALITGNWKHFRPMHDDLLKNGPGVWMIDTDDPNAQVERMKKAIKATKLNTVTSRVGKKVYVGEHDAEVTDCVKKTKVKVPYKK